MQQIEDAKSVLTELISDQNRVTEELVVAQKELELKIAQLDQENLELVTLRAQLVGQIPAELTALYEKIKSDQGDVGAAMIHRGACQGCHLALDATELDRIKSLSADAIVRCDECRRILIRTSESGL
jgi:predicted  nucleic acid-binding Zn-ribbon protein